MGQADLHDLLRDATRRLNTHKVIVVGDGRVGKTSMLRRLRGEEFRHGEESTRGAELCSVTVREESWSDGHPVADITDIMAAAWLNRSENRPTVVADITEQAEPLPQPQPQPQRKLQSQLQSNREPAEAEPVSMEGLGRHCHDQEPVSSAIEITSHPIDACVEAGEETRVSVSASGGYPTEAVEYQWHKDGTAVEGQASAALQFKQTAHGNAGRYHVEVWCKSQPRRVRSKTMKLRVMRPITAKVSEIIRTKGAALTDDSPRVVVVDVAGQRMYYILHRILLTEALTMYVVVVSLECDLDSLLTQPGQSSTRSEASEEDLPYEMTHRQNLLFWLNSIYGRAPTAPILIVCTKADLVDDYTRDQRIDAVQDCYESSVVMSNIVGLRVVSSKTGEGIDEVRNVLHESRTSLKRYGSEVPIGWFKFSSIIRELAEQQEPRITLSEARSIARDCGVATDEELNALLQEMHDVGFAIWHDTERARELVVLNVDWMIKNLTRMLCKRLLRELSRGGCACDLRLIKLLREQGRLEAAAVPAVWSELRSDQEREGLLQYMVQFGLCSVLPIAHEAASTWLVPALFEKAPALVWMSNEQHDKQLRVRFIPQSLEWPSDAADTSRDFLPDTLFYHLLARSVTLQPKEPKLFSDRMVVQTRDVRYMVEHRRADQLLVLTVYGEQQESPRIVCNQLDAVLCEIEASEKFGLKYHC